MTGPTGALGGARRPTPHRESAPPPGVHLDEIGRERAWEPWRTIGDLRDARAVLEIVRERLVDGGR